MAGYALLLWLSLGVVAGEDSLEAFLHKHGEKRKLEHCLGDARGQDLTKDDYKPGVCQTLGFRVCLRFLNDDGTPFIFLSDVDSEHSSPDAYSGKNKSAIEGKNLTDDEVVRYHEKCGDKSDTDDWKLCEDKNKDGLDWWEWSLQQGGETEDGGDKEGWIKEIASTGGHHWCACAGCASEAVERFGCDNLDIQCNATDVAFLRFRVEHDKKEEDKHIWECLKQKCGEDYQKGWPIVGDDCKHRGCARLYEEDAIEKVGQAFGDARGSIATLAFASFAVAAVTLVVGLSFWRRRSAMTAAPFIDVDGAGVE
jgi:hypothetical protein